MEYIKKAKFLFVILALVSAMVAFQAHADDDSAFDIVGWSDENGLDSIVSVKVNGVELSEYNPSMYDSVPEINTVMAEPSEDIRVEITLEDGYTLRSEKNGFFIYLSGVQSGSRRITGSMSTSSIRLPASEWRERDEELYLSFKTERKPRPNGAGMITVNNVVLDVNEEIDCGTEIDDPENLVPDISVPSGRGYMIVPDSICTVRKEGVNYIENVSPFVAKGMNSVIFKVDIVDRGSYVFSKGLSRRNIIINNGTLLDFEMNSKGDNSSKSRISELCLTVSIDLQHKTGSTWKEDGVQPTCTKSGHYFKVGKCKICKENIRSKVNIPPLGHSWKDEWSKDAEKHWHDCDNCTERNDETPHAFSAWLSVDETSHKRTCECGAEETAAHSFGTEGDSRYTCTACGYVDENLRKAYREKDGAEFTASVSGSSAAGKVTVKWGKVPGAGRYVVYANYCDKNHKAKFKKIKTVGAKVTKYNITRLNGKKINPKKNVKVYITAQRKQDGKWKKLFKTPVFHIAGAKTKYSNVKKITVRKASFTLEEGRTAKIKPKLVLVNKKKKAVIHDRKFRFKSTSTAVVKVTKSGKLKAVGKGSATVFVYSNNGTAKAVKVKVK